MASKERSLLSKFYRSIVKLDDTKRKIAKVKDKLRAFTTQSKQKRKEKVAAQVLQELVSIYNLDISFSKEGRVLGLPDLPAKQKESRHKRKAQKTTRKPAQKAIEDAHKNAPKDTPTDTQEANASFNKSTTPTPPSSRRKRQREQPELEVSLSPESISPRANTKAHRVFRPDREEDSENEQYPELYCVLQGDEKCQRIVCFVYC